jgi:two-component system, chemotaxis family, protein-glutamate methylesterase/glutaminase
MGQDGLAGARQLRALGSTILVQDEASSVVWGMPGFVAREGLAHAVCDLRRIAPEILSRL